MAPVNASSPHYLTILFLLGQSIELALKSFLRSRGYTEAQLVRIKHNLPKSLRAAVNHGFPKPHPTDVQLLELLDATYGAQRKLQYHRASAVNLPLLRPVRALAGEYLVHSFMFLGGSPSNIGDRGPEVYGLFVDPTANYEGPSLADFRISADGVNLRSLSAVCNSL